MSERDWQDGPPEERQESVLAGSAPGVDEPAADEASEDEYEPAATVAPVGTLRTTEPPADNGRPVEHAAGEFAVPAGYAVLSGTPRGTRRSVGVVVSRFNGAVTSKLLEGALEELERAGVSRDAITLMPVPGAFELPLAAMALAKTRRYACVLALGCVIRGDTPHFEYVASEAASGLQLAALETGIPVSFGVLTCDNRKQAEARAGGRYGNKGAEAARSGLEMADVFARLRDDRVEATGA